MFVWSRRSAQTVLVGAVWAVLLPVLPGACSLPDYEFSTSTERQSCDRNAQCEPLSATKLCDTKAGKCVECLPSAASSGCGPGQYCDSNRCSVGCSSNDECPTGLECDVESHQCRGCEDGATDACAVGTSCKDGRCVPSCENAEDCPAGFSCCNGACANPASDPSHCGRCGNVCGVAEDCINGACGTSGLCRSGRGDCDGRADNGCETVLNDPVANCGDCNVTCAPPHATAECSTGTCRVASCDPGYADCDPQILGCETPLGTTENCAECGDSCKPTNAESNACAEIEGGWTCRPRCIESFDDCDGKPSNGCETDLRSPEHCGACNHRCSLKNTSTYTCEDGTCLVASCSPGFDNCDDNSSNGCELPVRDDPMNCGKCKRQCSNVNGTGSCVDGQCQIACKADFGDCNEDNADGCEQDLRSSTRYCGDCKNTCTEPFCVNGVCKDHLDIVVMNSTSHDIRASNGSSQVTLAVTHQLQSAPSPRRLILVGVATMGNSAPAPSAVLYQNMPMEPLQTIQSNNQVWTGIYGLIESKLAPGAYQVSVQVNAAFAVGANVVELNNVEPSGLNTQIGGSKHGNCTNLFDDIEVATGGSFV
ncbi:MAG TPA: hypothetical protein VFQ61_19965, partial [Polyangiaceae bacterium]|nr:hypothetical protein [Polyangiaceae bacterium]